MMLRMFSSAVVVALVLGTGSASAGMLDTLRDGANNAMTANSDSTQATGGSALLSQLATGSFNLGGAKNVAGVLGYCQKQGYTQGATDQVKSQLLQKFGGQSAVAQNSAYQQGESGILQSEEGHQFTLANLKGSIGQRVCGMVAKKAMASFLGS